MRWLALTVALSCSFDSLYRASAGIPEPDVVLFGSMCVDGVPRSRSNTDVVLTANVEFGGQSHVVGRYQMGDSSAAGDIYVLRIKRESGVDGSAQSLDAARSEQQVNLRVQVGSEPIIDAGTFILDDAGTARRLDLDVGDARGIDGDRDADLMDFAMLQRCFTGSGSSTVAMECTSADRDGDGDIDLDDSRVLVNETAGPCG